MNFEPNILEFRLDGCPYGLSARRLWEHTELGQINLFPHSVSSPLARHDSGLFIDVVRFDGNGFSLTGLTLAELRGAKKQAGTLANDAGVLLKSLHSTHAVAFLVSVTDHLRLCLMRQAMRNQQHQFLPPALVNDVFGIPLVFSTLQRRLRTMTPARANARQWLATIENLQKKGLRAEELERSRLLPELAALDDSGDQAAASQLAELCKFDDLRLSVIPVVRDARRQLRFTSTLPPKALRSAQKLPKAQRGQERAILRFDPVLGYRIEQIEHQTLWGPELHWQAVTFDGRVIHNVLNRSLLPTAESAAALAASHAKQHFPKRVVLGRWEHLAWPGGEDYREWLITLPQYPGSFFSSHFNIRNILAHVRCDVRQGADDERILMLHEVQSDWAQSARRAISAGDMDPGDDECPPFLKEWPALAMKLVLLHAASQGLDAVAWTRGAHQVIRYKGLGAAGLIELYDRALPREVDRMMKPYGSACEMLGVFVPTNFRIRQSEDGYEVYTADNKLLATMPTLEDAKQFVPDGAHELLYEVHGVRLSSEQRLTILSGGFPAWG